MRPVHQTIFDANAGNCFTACLASILELSIDQVPNFAADRGDDWERAASDWLSLLGLEFLTIGFAHYETFTNTFFACPGRHCILSGPSTFAGRGHAVVGRVREAGGLDVVHDPMPGGRGPLQGFRWVRFIVPRGIIA